MGADDDDFLGPDLAGNLGFQVAAPGAGDLVLLAFHLVSPAALNSASI